MIAVSLRLFVVILTLMIVLGCDPVRTTKQVVSIDVKYSDERPISDCQAYLLQALDVNVGMEGSGNNHSVGAKQLLETWKQLPWQSAMTDVNGRASVAIIKTRIDKTNAKKPSKELGVAGKRYLLAIEIDGIPLFFDINLVVGEKYEQNGITVMISDITEPVYMLRAEL